MVALVAEPVALDPAQVTDLNSNRVGRRVVETLVAFAEESTQLVPGLAESWTISKDGLAYTFKLRKGIAFHDGTPFNAQAVKFSIERQINPEHPANKLGKYPFAGYFFGNVKAVEVMDDSTVRFILKEARASFLAVLTAGAASIVSPTAAMKAGQDYAVAPVGTGPFKFVQWDRGQRVVLEKNPAYWRFPVKVDRVIFRSITEDQARLTELLTGAVDLIVSPPPDSVADLENNPKVTLRRAGGRPRLVPRLQQQQETLRRQAGASGAQLRGRQGGDRPRRAQGHRRRLQGPGAARHLGRRGRDQALPLRPGARQEAPRRGRPAATASPPPCGCPSRDPGMQSPVAMSTIIQSNLKAVGVNVALQTMEWGTFLAKLRTKEQDMFALSWMAGSEDPDLVMYPLLHSSQWTPAGPNRAMYKNARFDEVLTQARLTTDQAKRAQLYREAQRLLHDDPPWIFIDHEVQTAAFTKRVQGFKLHPSFDLHLETISLK